MLSKHYQQCGYMNFQSWPLWTQFFTQCKITHFGQTCTLNVRLHVYNFLANILVALSSSKFWRKWNFKTSNYNFVPIGFWYFLAPLCLLNELWSTLIYSLGGVASNNGWLKPIKTSHELQMLSLSLFIQGSLWMLRLLFSIVRNVISVSKVTVTLE